MEVKSEHLCYQNCDNYNRRIISFGQSSRSYKNTPTRYIASVSALPFPHRSMLTRKLSWAKPNIVPQYTTLSGGGKGEGVERKTAVSKTTSQTIIRWNHHCPIELVRDCTHARYPIEFYWMATSASIRQLICLYIHYQNSSNYACELSENVY